MSDFRTWKVLAEGASWVVRSDRASGDKNRHEQRAEAVDEAKRLAIENAPGQVVVHARDGSVKYAVLFRETSRRAGVGVDPQRPDRARGLSRA